MWAFLRDHNYHVSKHLTSNLLMSVMVLSTSVFTFGFETAVLSTVQAMSQFEKRFGEWNPETEKYFISPSKLAYLNSFPLIAYAVGVVVAAQISERWGRRIIVLIMNTICIGGVLLSLFSKNYGQTLGGRMLIQIHVGMEAYLVPMYVAELVPAAIRGAMVATYAFSHILAAFIASIITNFTSRIDGHASWRIPIGLIMIFPSVVLVTSFLIPESPRWLLRKGRFEEAVDNIYYLRGADRDYPAEEEARLILETIHNATSQGRWNELFKGTNARRTWVGILAAASTQLTGQSFASNYGTVLLKSLNVMDPFTATMIKRAVVLAACIFVIVFVERIGRRRLCLIVGSMCAACLLIMGGLGTITPRQTDTSNGILALTIIFPVLYMVGFGSMYALTFWRALEICKKLIIARSLEEIDEMVESKVPAWRSREWKSSGLGSKLTELVNRDKEVLSEGKGDHVEHLDTK
ncbi:hypothetical protein BHE90_011145 [Fusarium euwallaceae]|uniref:Major facilitator superfamily (MFS) profile domain-containing protein n=1 Tax=Fusarium euwallaceae TaxID=1147111 RepID=A0A430LFC2_9HYPO|nr:hypothetical protein BHE90_011145 [Fusarium euwallaceae]